jgi:alpha-L-rhamnosidase
MNSQNHYAYGVIAEWLYRDMLGMGADYEDAGFHHIVLAPKPDMREESELPPGQKRIDWARGSFMTPYGLFSSEWRRDKDGKIRYTFEIPFNCRATFYRTLPNGLVQQLELETGKWTF